MEELRYESFCLPINDSFPWKVGGHHPIKLYSEGIICKPLNSREATFYEQIPELLRDFVPTFHGVAADKQHGVSRGTMDMVLVSKATKIRSEYLMLGNLTC